LDDVEQARYIKASAHLYATYRVLHCRYLSMAAEVRPNSEALGKDCAAMELQAMVLFSN
jgi:hypothetical protein